VQPLRVCDGSFYSYNDTLTMVTTVRRIRIRIT
jgi:hypothetical protein